MKKYVFLLSVIGLINIAISASYFLKRSNTQPLVAETIEERRYFLLLQNTEAMLKYDLISGISLLTVAIALAARYKIDDD